MNVIRVIVGVFTLALAAPALAGTIRLVCHRGGDLPALAGFHRFELQVSNSGEVNSVKSETWPGELRIWQIPAKREIKPFADFYPPREIEITFEHFPPNKPKDAGFTIHRYTLEFQAWHFDEAGKSTAVIKQGRCWIVGEQKF